MCFHWEPHLDSACFVYPKRGALAAPRACLVLPILLHNDWNLRWDRDSETTDELES